MGGVQGDVIQGFGPYAAVQGFDFGIGGAVTADGFILFQGLFRGTPGGGPEIAAFVVPQVDIPAGLVELVEHIPENPSGGAGLDEGIAAGVLGDDGAVGGTAQVIGPGHGRAGVGDDVFPGRVVEVTVLHPRYLL